MATEASSSERVKDVLLEHISRDVKALQSNQCDIDQMEDMVTISNTHVQALCEHFDRVLLHGLRSTEMGYWAVAKYFTRSEAVRVISQLTTIKTNLGRGRAWLYLALNEQSLESYVRMFHDNQMVMQNFYLRGSFLRDMERLDILETLVAGLDFIAFELPIESIYLDYGATRATSTVGTLQSSDITPDVQPAFISAIKPGMKTPEPWSTDPPVNVVSTPPPPPSSSSISSSLPGNLLTSLFTSKEKKVLPIPAVKEPVLLGAEGSPKGGVAGRDAEQKEEELRSSVSPHRPLTQTSLEHSEMEEAGKSRTGSFTSQSRLPLPGSEVNNQEDEEEEKEESLVERRSKSKSGKEKAKKKKKKKKRPKSDDAADSQAAELESSLPPIGVASFPVPGVAIGDGTTTVASGDRDPQPSQAEEAGAKIDSTPKPRPSGAEKGGVEETDGQSEPANPFGDFRAGGNPFDRGDSPLKEGKPQGNPFQSDEEEERDSEERTRATTYRVKKTVLPWEEDYAPKGATPPSHQGGGLMEECDTGFGRGVEPLPLPQPSSSKRLSLADELEMAIGEQETTTTTTTTPPDSKKEVMSSSGPHPQSSDADVEEQATAGGPQGLSASSNSTPSSRRKDDFQSDSSVHDSAELRYDGSPLRPREITEKDRRANDIEIDDNARLVISLDILHTEEEKLKRLVQVATPTGVGQQRTCYILVTSDCTYILKRDGVEGHYSKEIAIKYSNFDHIVIGLGWQSLHLVYRTRGGHVETSPSRAEYIVLTGSEAVSRSIVDTIRATAAACPDFMRSIPLNKDDESRVEAIEKELIKLGSETSMEIEQYMLVNWEQLSGGEGGAVGVGAEVGGVSRSGSLQIKTTNLIGIASWRPAHFVVKGGSLYQFASDEDEEARNVYHLRSCGGCVRATSENRPFALSILGSDQSPVLVLAASNEEELTEWMVALCEAQLVPEKPGSPTIRKPHFFCALLLTQNMIHVLQEDWINKSVQLVASCAVTDVNDISVDKSLPLYCTISYDHDADEGVWLVCFNTEYELGKFEAALGLMWQEQFQIGMQFSEVQDPLTRQRAHRAVELMQGSKFRSDSMTKGRTEFTYSGRF